jgi:hypothetical protein
MIMVPPIRPKLMGGPFLVIDGFCTLRQAHSAGTGSPVGSSKVVFIIF